MENRDIRIAFFDIDGTLLPPDHHLPESTVAALNILRAKGVQLYLATGRPPYHLHYLKNCASCCPGWKKQILRFPLWKRIPLT